jgi:hypothetical protein
VLTVFGTIEGSGMKKRAVDLSLEELAAMGANAALRAAREAQDAGLVIAGTVDFLEEGQSISTLAERHPSGTVTLLDAAEGHRDSAGQPGTVKTADRPDSTD